MGEFREPTQCDDCLWAMWAAINNDPNHCAGGHHSVPSGPCCDWRKYDPPTSMHDAAPTPPSEAWRNLPDIPFCGGTTCNSQDGYLSC